MESVAEGVRLAWAWTGEENKECEPYFLITGYQNGGPFSERVSDQLREFTFQNAIGGEWHVEMRAGNRVGTGPSSSPVNLQSASLGIFQILKLLQRRGPSDERLEYALGSKSVGFKSFSGSGSNFLSSDISVALRSQID